MSPPNSNGLNVSWETKGDWLLCWSYDTSIVNKQPLNTDDLYIISPMDHLEGLIGVLYFLLSFIITHDRKV